MTTLVLALRGAAASGGGQVGGVVTTLVLALRGAPARVVEVRWVES